MRCGRPGSVRKSRLALLPTSLNQPYAGKWLSKSRSDSHGRQVPRFRGRQLHLVAVDGGVAGGVGLVRGGGDEVAVVAVEGGEVGEQRLVGGVHHSQGKFIGYIAQLRTG
jgi:hypothetical protein